MKKFNDLLREYAKSIIDFEKKKMLLLTTKKLKSHEYAEQYYFCGIKLFKKLFRDRNYRKDRNHCNYTSKHRNAAHSICDLKFNVPNEIREVFYNGSNDDYHFIIKELANESKE